MAHAGIGSKVIEECTLDEIKELLSTDGLLYKRVYSETGNVETFVEPLALEFVDYFSSELYSRSASRTQAPTRAVTNPFTVTTIVDSGLPDSQSIVVVFMGDGFTSGTGANQQGSWPNPTADSFLAQANNAAQTLINTHPFDQVAHLFKIYAVQVTSTDAGITGAPDGTGPSRNTYFEVNFTEKDSITMPSGRQTHALELAQAVSSSVVMVQVIANADAHGGVSFTGSYINTTSIRLALTATQSTNNSFWSPAWHGTVIHEFGHAFGQLIDEHDTS